MRSDVYVLRISITICPLLKLSFRESVSVHQWKVLYNRPPETRKQDECFLPGNSKIRFCYRARMSVLSGLNEENPKIPVSVPSDGIALTHFTRCAGFSNVALVPPARSMTWIQAPPVAPPPPRFYWPSLADFNEKNAEVSGSNGDWPRRPPVFLYKYVKRLTWTPMACDGVSYVWANQ